MFVLRPGAGQALALEAAGDYEGPRIAFGLQAGGRGALQALPLGACLPHASQQVSRGFQALLGEPAAAAAGAERVGWLPGCLAA